MKNLNAIRGFYYPAIPSWWPNRQVRRAVRQGRESRLPAEWKAFLGLNPNLRQTIRTL